MQISAELRAARVISLNKISRHLIRWHIYICTAHFISLDPKALLKCSRMLKLKNILEVLILSFSLMYPADICAVILTSYQWKSEMNQSISPSNHLPESIHPGPFITRSWKLHACFLQMPSSIYSQKLRIKKIPETSFFQSYIHFA